MSGATPPSGSDGPRSRRWPAGGSMVALAGCVLVALSMFLPWYGVPTGGGLSKTAIDTFDLLAAALLLTIAAVAWLCLRPGDGVLPRPLGEGALLIAAGIWCGVLLGYRLLVRPEFPFADPADTGIRYGLLFAYAGAALLAAGGVRRRREGRSGAAANA